MHVWILEDPQKDLENRISEGFIALLYSDTAELMYELYTLMTLLFKVTNK